LLAASNTTAFMVVKDAVILCEKYFDGYGRAIPSLLFSMAESFLSLLVGCALEDGYLRSVDQPVPDFGPELASSGFTGVTLKHLLQMRSGVDYSENDNPIGIHAQFYYTNRLEKEILKLRLRETPGGRFVYKSGDALLLTLALRRALGRKTITEYTQERIWTPLGMEYDGSWSIDHAPDGLEKTRCCLTATARDFAKIGVLFLNKGRWDGRRIVSEAWVTESTRVDMRSGDVSQYRYMWWTVATRRSAFMAIGHLGQSLYVDPVARIIVVRLGKDRGG
jgi:CubicO group peptidase (beta-lactamase class C family)